MRQPVGTERFSLVEFLAHTGLNASAEIDVKVRRDVVDALATVAWLRCLRTRSKGASPYAIGQVIEPEGYWKTDERVRFHRNKWSRYERGKHRPSDSLVDIADKAYPGSSKELNSVLWRFLRRVPSSVKALAELEEQLDPKVRLLINRWRPAIQSSKTGSIKRLASALELVGTADGLAAMLLLCQSSKVQGQTSEAHEWSLYIYRCMLILGVFWTRRGVAKPLLELIEQRFLNHVSHLGARYVFPSSLYSEAIGRLEEVLWHIEPGPEKITDETCRSEYAQRVLNGEYGWDLKFAFNPYETLTSADEASDAQTDTCLRKQRLFIWAWNILYSGKPHPGVPPKQVFDGSDLHARWVD